MKSLFERLKEMLFKNTKHKREGFFDGATQEECEQIQKNGVSYIQYEPCDDINKMEE